jgi:hypothetical protein
MEDVDLVESNALDAVSKFNQIRYQYGLIGIVTHPPCESVGLLDMHPIFSKGNFHCFA